MDEYRLTYHYVAALLERGVRALIYVGKNDWICNHVGNEAWTRALEWTGHAEFAGAPLHPWNVSGAQAGMARSARGLTFATIEGAGHMVRRLMEASVSCWFADVIHDTVGPVRQAQGKLGDGE